MRVKHVYQTSLLFFDYNVAPERKNNIVMVSQTTRPTLWYIVWVRGEHFWSFWQDLKFFVVQSKIRIVKYMGLVSSLCLRFPKTHSSYTSVSTFLAKRLFDPLVKLKSPVCPYSQFDLSCFEGLSKISRRYFTMRIGIIRMEVFASFGEFQN